MRAVNQSIGRSIRHANDYSAVLLVDQRYQSDPTVAKKLPQWMMRSAVRPSTFGEAIRELRTFFASTKAAAS
jgi:chromosome transmission fidelity protein 1